MIAAVVLGWRLATGRTRGQLLRAICAVLGVLIGVLVLLSTAAIVEAERAARPYLFHDVDNVRLLLVVVTAVSLPALALIVTVARLSAAMRDRRLAGLRLIGVGATGTRVAAAVETGAPAVIGATLAVVAFLAFRNVLPGLAPTGHTWLLPSLWPPALVWVAATVGPILLAAAVAAVAIRTDAASSLVRARRAESPRPRWWRLVPLVAGVAIGVVLLVHPLPPDRDAGNLRTQAFFASTILCAFGVVAATPVVVRAVADLTVRISSRPLPTITARRVQAQPATLTRLVTVLVIALFVITGARSVLVAFETTPQYEHAASALRERVIIPFDASPASAPGLARNVRAVHGVDAVETIPIVNASCGTRGGCSDAMVADCAQLQRLIPSLSGCRDGLAQSFVGTRLRQTANMVTLAPRATKRSSIYLRVRTTPVTMTSSLAMAYHRSAVGPLPSIVVPPSTPGISALTGRTTQFVVAAGPPRRDLIERLRSVPGINGYESPDLESYDQVAALRTLVWTVAAVLIGIGLLGFLIAAIDHSVLRRREVVALQLVGVPRRTLRTAQWLEALGPVTVGAVLAVAAGLLVGACYLGLAGESGQIPWSAAFGLLGIAVLGGAVIGGLTVPPAAPRISPGLIRQE